MIEKASLAKVHRLAWSSEDVRVRRTAVMLLTSGVALTESRDEARDFVTAGCSVEYDYVDHHGWMYVIRCPGARECYTNEDLYPNCN